MNDETGNPIPPVPTDVPSTPDTGGPGGVPPNQFNEWAFDDPVVRINARTFRIQVGVAPQYQDTAQIELHVPVPPALTEPPAIVRQGDKLSIETVFDPVSGGDPHDAYAVAMVGTEIVPSFVRVMPEEH